MSHTLYIYIYTYNAKNVFDRSLRESGGKELTPAVWVPVVGIVGWGSIWSLSRSKKRNEGRDVDVQWYNNKEYKISACGKVYKARLDIDIHTSMEFMGMGVGRCCWDGSTCDRVDVFMGDGTREREGGERARRVFVVHIRGPS